MSLRFSAHPGCWERQLQRKYQNAVFPVEQQNITQVEVDAAQVRDQQEREAFAENFRGLLDEVAGLDKRVDTSVIFQLKTRVDALYDECSSLGGDYGEAKNALRQLNELIMQTIWDSGEHDTQAKEALKKEAQTRHDHMALLEEPFIAHLLRPESPIAQDELIPTLLAESEQAVQAAMRLFDHEHQRILCTEAEKLLQLRQAEGAQVAQAQQRLALMQSLSR